MESKKEEETGSGEGFDDGKEKMEIDETEKEHNEMLNKEGEPKSSVQNVNNNNNPLEEMLQKSFHQYLLENKMSKTAEAFQEEARFTNDPIDIKDPASFIWQTFKEAYSSLRAENDASSLPASAKVKKDMEAGTGNRSRIPLAAREFECRNLPPFRQTYLRERKHGHSGNTIQDAAFEVPKERGPAIPDPKDRAFLRKKVVNKGKVVCCDLSSDGKWLAWVGEDRKVGVMQFPSLGYTDFLKTHASDVTDIRFFPSGKCFGTSSLDGTIRIWDCSNRRTFIDKINLKRPLQSLDFHPKKQNVLCCCDDEGGITILNCETLLRTEYMGASKKVRFQPGEGRLLAGIEGNMVSVVDCVTGRFQFQSKEHHDELRCICWNKTGEYLASVSEDIVCIWSSTGELAYTLCPTGDDFLSCTFHPEYDCLLVIGGNKYLDLWHPSFTNSPLKVRAHANLIVSLAGTSADGGVASVSHDRTVKAWKLQWPHIL